MIRNHGYRQNGQYTVVTVDGGRTQSDCLGVGYPPYEVSRARLLDEIAWSEAEIARLKEDRRYRLALRDEVKRLEKLRQRYDSWKIPTAAKSTVFGD